MTLFQKSQASLDKLASLHHARSAGGTVKLCILLLAGLCTGVFASEKPNILLILADDLGYGDVENDCVPVPPTGPLDKSKLPKHPYANDCRAGLIAPDFPMEEVDLVFLKP